MIIEPAVGRYRSLAFAIIQYQCDSQLQKTIGTKNHRNQAKSVKTIGTFFKTIGTILKTKEPQFFSPAAGISTFILVF